jgi:ABC-type nickel/cobalt efflux system permease component RcnA
VTLSENHAALTAQRVRNSQLAVWIGIVVSMLISSIGSVLAGNSWLLFGSLPLAGFAAWMFVRTWRDAQTHMVAAAQVKQARS